VSVLQVLLNALQVAGLQKSDVTHVVLMGGTSRVPYAAELVG
jgi:molecular chaperone DnaK (HSP70)